LHEIGIRIALGARASDVVKAIFSKGVQLGAAVIALGVVLAWGVTRFMSALLFGIRANDGFTFAGAVSVLMAVIVGAFT
jgi:ABC-type antimicrobial peptide transport system permease subunit